MNDSDAPLRYSDGPSTEAELRIDASPTDVWTLVSDINLPARFSSEFKGAQWLDGAIEPAVGATFQGHNAHPAGGEWETTATITEFEPQRVFGWVIGDTAEPSARWRFTLADDGGATRLTQWMRMGPGRSGLNPAIDAMPDKEDRIIRRRLDEHQRNMTANLEGVRTLLERGR